MGPHGKRWTFVKYKCRCKPCCMANDAYMIGYRERNRAKILAKEAERYQRNKDAIIARTTARYQRAKDAILERQATESVRMRRAMSESARRARKVKQFVEDVDPAVLWLIDGMTGICNVCGKVLGVEYQIDHIMPLSRGGLHCYANTQLVHPKCNERKHNRVPTIEELEITAMRF